MKKISKLLVIISLLFSSIMPIYALENKNEDVAGIKRSGGLVSSTYTLKKCTNKGTTTKRVYLTSAWAKASSYTVTKNVTITSSTTVSIGINSSVKDQIKAQTGLSYGTSVSNSVQISTTIPADSSRYSKLVFSSKMQNYSVSITVANKYYDTSTGYYTLYTDYNGDISIPLKDTAKMEIVYQ